MIKRIVFGVLLCAGVCAPASALPNFFGNVVSSTNTRTNIIDLTKSPYSIDPTGTIDATAVIQNAITFNSGPNVEFDFCPSTTTGARVHYKISATINIGNGTPTSNSTINQGIAIKGCGSGVQAGSSVPYQGTSFDWYGVQGGTAFNLQGPIYSMAFSGFYVDCRGLCNTGLNLNNFGRSTFDDVWVENYAGTGWVITANLSDTTFSGGTQNNIFTRTGDGTYVTGTTGCQIGALGSSANFDVSGNVWIDPSFAGSTGCVIAMADGNQFYGGGITGTGGPAINWTVEENGVFPGAIYFEGTGFSAGTVNNYGVFKVTGTYIGEPGQMGIIGEWNDGGGNSPAPPLAANGGAGEPFSGTTTSGVMFGPQQSERFVNTSYGTTLSASGLFSNTYTFPYQYFNHPNASVHVSATISSISTVNATDKIYPYLSLGGVTCGSFVNQPVLTAQGTNDMHVEFDLNILSAFNTNMVFNATGQYQIQTDSIGSFVDSPNIGVINASNCSIGVNPANPEVLAVGLNINGSHTTANMTHLRVDGNYAVFNQ